MNKDYFFKLWVISLMLYVPIFQFMGEHMESGFYERLFRAYNILNLLFLGIGLVLLCLKWKYMLNTHRVLSIIGILINIGLVYMLFSSWHTAWIESGQIFQY